MLGEFKATFKEFLTTEDGGAVVSFAVGRADAFAAKKCAAAMRTAAASGKGRLKVAVGVDRPIRSLDANAYMWELCGKIAEKIKTTKEEIYIEAIKRVGVWQDCVLPSKAAKTICTGWSRNGIGWYAEIVAENDTHTQVRLYYGSSVYSKKQMARLIDEIVSEAKELDIETRTPQEIAELNEKWEAKT